MFKKSYRQAWRAEVYTALPKSDLSKVKVSVSTKNGVGTSMVRKQKQTNQKTGDDFPRVPCAKGKSNESMISIKQKQNTKCLR